MSGPFPLREEEVAALEARPGVYVLGRERAGGAHGIYVGRAEGDLGLCLRQHLPDAEANLVLRIAGADRFWFRYTETATEAFRMECLLYHAHRYFGNLTHPIGGGPRPWPCPVCEPQGLGFAAALPERAAAAGRAF